MSFAGLLYQQNTQDPQRAKFLGDAQARITDISQPLVFFSLELNRLEEDWLAERLAASTRLASSGVRPGLKPASSIAP